MNVAHVGTTRKVEPCRLQAGTLAVTIQYWHLDREAESLTTGEEGLFNRKVSSGFVCFGAPRICPVNSRYACSSRACDTIYNQVKCACHAHITHETHSAHSCAAMLERLGCDTTRLRRDHTDSDVFTYVAGFPALLRFDAQLRFDLVFLCCFLFISCSCKARHPKP